MSCLALGANPALFDVLFCGIQLGAGGMAIAGLLLFIILLYGMYKARIPFIVMVPIGIMILFVFAGAGIEELSQGIIYTNLMWIGVMFIGAIVLLAFWKLRRPF